jgi:predicted ATPase
MVNGEGSRLVTLTGPGGTGKTRLAIETAGRFLEPLNGAVWFAPLADVSDPALLAGALVDALSLPRSGEAEPLDQAVAALSSQPSLLVLDNFEQLVENGGAEVVQDCWRAFRP